MPNVINQPVVTKNATILLRLVLVAFLSVVGLSACGTASPVSTSTAHFQILGSASAGALSIERIQLDFGAGKSSITVKQNSQVNPVATIKYTGVGFFSARWILDGRVISQFSTTLSRGSTLVLSPNPTSPIPTFNLGRHELRLEVVQPGVTFIQPRLSFFVAV